MNVPPLDLTKIPVTRSGKSTDITKFFVQDKATLLTSARQWVHRVSHAALRMALDAGNPETYFVTIDGIANASGTVRRGFKSGTIDESKHAVRIEFTAEQLASIARGLSPILRGVIRRTFPDSRTKRLARDWSWWHAPGGGRASHRVGRMPPASVGIYDTLYLAPDEAPARYAFFANMTARRSHGYKYNMTRGRKGTASAGEFRLKKRTQGYLARSTKLMRGKRVPGLITQGGFSRKYMTGGLAVHPRGVPFVRVKFKSGLAKPVFV